ncbi:MAG: hypothetical protein K2X11_12235 [Acetobacteraceae bacterium]|nr:hypothetical protein [Acetobacteraceae bacterium]
MSGRAPFGLDPERIREVGADGRPRNDAPPPAFLGRRHRLVLALFGLALFVIGTLAGLAAAAFATGARGWAGVFALMALGATPLLAIGPLQDRWRHRRR